jgi:octaprenyl-diphosphate synthase
MPLTAAPSPVTDVTAIKALVARDFSAVDELIHNQLASNVPLIRDVCKHIIGSGGKRLRPLLVLLVANALNYPGEDHIKVATIIEFIHTATLLHDDVIDNSAMRRGDRTANDIWGNSTSILVGDFLTTRTFQLISQLRNFEAIDILARTTNSITEGEVKQLINRNNADISETQYFEVIRDKTARLFQAAAEMTATICKAPEALCQAVGLYALNLGTAFQLIDDALDYIGDSRELGKNTGDDLAEGKTTLPLIYALQHASPSDAACIRHAIENSSSDNLPTILSTIARTNAVKYTLDRAKQLAEQAIDHLDPLPPSLYRDGLQNLAEFAIKRQS